MAKERNYDRVFLITDHPAAGQTDTLRVITVGRPETISPSALLIFLMPPWSVRAWKPPPK